MSTSSTITISNIPVEVVRKPIRNLHLGVYPPDGRVRVAVPNHVSDDNVRLAVISKLSWIKKQQADFAAQPRQTERSFVSGETHYVWGRPHRLHVTTRHGKHEIRPKGNKELELFINPGTSPQNRELVLNEWYRAQLRERIPELIAKWEEKVGKSPTFWGIKRMRTKWGSCNTTSGRIWLNLELAKKSPECLEYILVHELIHLHERHHNERFRAFLDRLMPQWRLYRDKLKSEPLAHEDWKY